MKFATIFFLLLFGLGSCVTADIPVRDCNQVAGDLRTEIEKSRGIFLSAGEIAPNVFIQTFLQNGYDVQYLYVWDKEPLYRIMAESEGFERVDQCTLPSQKGTTEPFSVLRRQVRLGERVSE